MFPAQHAVFGWRLQISSLQESTHRTRARLGASATPEVQEVETPSTPAKRGRGRGASIIAKIVEEESHSTVTSTAQNRGKKTSCGMMLTMLQTHQQMKRTESEKNASHGPRSPFPSDSG